MPNGTIRFALAAACLAIALAAFVRPVLAAKQTALNATAVVSYRSVAQQKDTLESCGFRVSVTEDGASLIMEPTSSDFSAIGTGTMAKRHEALKDAGILSYAIHLQSPCEIVTQLAVILDFSDYNITSFGDNFLQALTYVIVGCGGGLLVGNQFTEVNEPDADGRQSLFVYNADGTESDETYTLQLGSMSTRYPSYINGNRIASYSLRIVLPRNNGSVIAFRANSLIAQGFAGQTWGVSPPKSIGLDLQNVTLTPNGDGTYSGITIDQNATDESTEHLHFIVSAERNAEYAFHSALTYLLSDTGATPVQELFFKENRDTFFTRLLAKAELTDDGMTVTVYDGDSAAEDAHAPAIVRLCRWLCYRFVLPQGMTRDQALDRLSLRHRSDAFPEEGIVTFERTAGSGAPGQAVYCSHFGTQPIGYFTPEGQI